METEAFVYIDVDGKPIKVGRLWSRILSTAIDLEDGTASLDLAMEVAEYFQLNKDAALRIAGEVGVAVSTWRRQARNIGIKKVEIDRMASAFEHKDLDFALKVNPKYKTCF